MYRSWLRELKGRGHCNIAGISPKEPKNAAPTFLLYVGFGVRDYAFALPADRGGLSPPVSARLAFQWRCGGDGREFKKMVLKKNLEVREAKPMEWPGPPEVSSRLAWQQPVFRCTKLIVKLNPFQLCRSATRCAPPQRRQAVPRQSRHRRRESPEVPSRLAQAQEAQGSVGLQLAAGQLAAGQQALDGVRPRPPEGQRLGVRVGDVGPGGTARGGPLQFTGRVLPRHGVRRVVVALPFFSFFFIFFQSTSTTDLLVALPHAAAALTSPPAAPTSTSRRFQDTSGRAGGLARWCALQ